ncbi:MAG: division/cell wall cluster transcriptional repressor MraZ [Chloroflexi bacterium]|nr:division/cell wall cluster transcriptional repressor MraZ [Chloroflexota bacterium]
MFFGEFAYKVDDKGRMPLPPVFRQYLKEGVVIRPGAEKCIVAKSLEQFQREAESIQSSRFSPAAKRRLERAIFGTAVVLSFDTQGRINLPTNLKSHAGIGSDSVVVGRGLSEFEIWSKKDWEEENAKAVKELAAILEELNNSQLGQEN